MLCARLADQGGTLHWARRRAQRCAACRTPRPWGQLPLRAQVWQEAVCPLLQAQLLAEPQGLSLYLTLFYGAATANFLEVGRPALRPCSGSSSR